MTLTLLRRKPTAAVFAVIAVALYLVSLAVIMYADELRAVMPPQEFQLIRGAALVGLLGFFFLILFRATPRFVFETVGWLDFRDDAIVLRLVESGREETFPFAEIERFEIHENESSQTWVPLGRLTHKIMLHAGETDTAYLFVLRSEREKQNFAAVLQRLYKAGVNLREYDAYGSRRFLFRGNLSYADVQKLKEEYDIPSWP